MGAAETDAVGAATFWSCDQAPGTTQAQIPSQAIQTPLRTVFTVLLLVVMKPKL